MFKRPWSPYVAGALTGVLLVLSVWIAGHFLGASTTFARSASVIEQTAGVDTAAIEYFTTKNGKYGPSSLPNWQFMLVLGIIIGAFAASTLAGEFKIQAVPDMWQNRFGANPVPRAIVAIIGGAIALFGARLAGGCPSGHGLSGMAQLSVSAFIALAAFFIAGMVAANLVYGKQRK